MQIIEVAFGADMQLNIVEGDMKTKFALKNDEKWSDRKGTNPGKLILIHDCKMARKMF